MQAPKVSYWESNQWKKKLYCWNPLIFLWAQFYFNSCCMLHLYSCHYFKSRVPFGEFYTIKNLVTLTKPLKNKLCSPNFTVWHLGSELMLYWTFQMFGEGPKKRVESIQVLVTYMTFFVWEIYFVHRPSKGLNLIFLFPLCEELLDSAEMCIIARKHWRSKFCLTWPLKWPLNHSHGVA